MLSPQDKHRTVEDAEWLPIRHIGVLEVLENGDLVPPKPSFEPDDFDLELRRRFPGEVRHG